MDLIKKIGQAVWEFLEAWGKYRHEMIKRRNYLYY